MSRFIRFGLASLALFLLSFAAKAQDPLSNARVRQELATQKLTAQVADALSASRRLEKTDPGEAKFILQRMIGQVKDATDLSLEKRSSLVRQLQLGIDDINSNAAARRVNQDLRPYAEKPKSQAPTYDTPRPKSVGSVIKDFQAPANNALKINQDAIRQREASILATFNSVEKSPPYPTDDRPIVFPSRAEWLRITERGKVRLSEKEASLLKALNSVMTPTIFDGEKFGLAVNVFQEKTGITLIFDQPSVEESRLDYEDTVAFKSPGKMTVRTILKKLLGDKNLTYVIKEGTVHVMTPRKAREMVVVRSYPVSDLIQPNQASQMFGPFVARAQMLQNVQQLIAMIQGSVDSSYWEAAGGPGRISFYEPAQALVVTGSAEMHYQLGGMGLLGVR